MAIVDRHFGREGAEPRKMTGVTIVLKSTLPCTSAETRANYEIRVAEKMMIATGANARTAQLYIAMLPGTVLSGDW